MTAVNRNLVTLRSAKKIVGLFEAVMALQSVVQSAHNGTTTGPGLPRSAM